MPGYRRHFQDANVVFLTLVTNSRRRWLSSDRSKTMVLEAMRETKRHHPFKHFAHVILDDHIHWLVQVGDDLTASDIVAKFKLNHFHRWQSFGPSNGTLWQSRFYDHIIRNERDFRKHMDYIHYNPVKHGYVTIARQWRWSSFHTWVERGKYSHCWGTKEPDGPGQAGEP